MPLTFEQYAESVKQEHETANLRRARLGLDPVSEPDNALPMEDRYAAYMELVRLGLRRNPESARAVDVSGPQEDAR